MPIGRVVLLNGTSSAGKSTVAHAMQELDPEGGWLHLGLDRMLEGVPRSLITYVDRDSREETDGWVVPFQAGAIAGLPRLGRVALRLLDAMYRGAAAMTSTGSAVILDDVIFDRRVLSLAARAMEATPCLFVGVRCPVQTAVERELGRGDRAPGGAAVFDTAVHSPGIYDLEVDTSVLDPDESARVILDAAAAITGPSVAIQRAAAAVGSGF